MKPCLPEQLEEEIRQLLRPKRRALDDLAGGGGAAGGVASYV